MIGYALKRRHHFTYTTCDDWYALKQRHQSHTRHPMIGYALKRRHHFTTCDDWVSTQATSSLHTHDIR
eukprot:635881-Amorphochlora_amoeboformis.AAC.2